ncbi:MAG: hypothetical protein KA734_06815 [Fluviicola sp.]|nr:hypothetical protein [Fluviicola sp.]
MIPGPNYVYECPSCKNIITNESIITGNSFGSTFYSDGKSVSIMMPDFPKITKCEKCTTIFWLDKQEVIGYINLDSNKPAKWRKADKARFLSKKDYFRALATGLAENKEEELFIRIRIMWAYNDRIRRQKEIFEDEQDERSWIENSRQLLSLLDLSTVNHQFVAAEIHRNLGDFDNCISVLNGIKKDDLAWVKEKLINECTQKNRWVIKLK